MTPTEHDAGAMRRGGGGSGFPIITSLGIMMIMMALLAPLCHKTRQAQIGAALFVGLLFGACGLDKNQAVGPNGGYAGTYLEFEVNAKLVELGNNLVLFFAGLSCKPEDFIEYFWAVSIIGSGYLVSASALFALVGWSTGLCEGIGSVIFFGVACSLSSRQLMMEHLVGACACACVCVCVCVYQSRSLSVSHIHTFYPSSTHILPQERELQLKTMHGRLLSGLSIYQDAIAIVAFTILYAFQQTMIDIDASALGSSNTSSIQLPLSDARRAGNATAPVIDADTWVPKNVWHDRFRLGDEIGRALGLMCLVGVVFALLNRFVLERLFRFFTIDGEMLFIGTMAYNFGASAICSQLRISPMIGSYFAGLRSLCV